MFLKKNPIIITAFRIGLIFNLIKVFIVFNAVSA